MELIICNAFSLNMLDRAEQQPSERPLVLPRTPVAITLEEAQRRVAQAAKLDVPVASAVGHADTAVLLGQQLGLDLPANRRTVKLGREDSLLVGQYSGPRLPEGTVELPPGAVIEWWAV